MILPLLLASTLAAATPAVEPAAEAAPEPAPVAASLPAKPAAASPALLEVPITLLLKDATVVDVLEKLADLLGVTPILDPGIGGRVTIDVRDLPISKALELVGKAAKVDITVSAKVLRARRRAGSTPGEAVPPATASKPLAGRVGDVLRFWLDGDPERRTTVHVPGYVGRVEIPGCSGPVTIGRLGHQGGRAFGVALASTDPSKGRARGRVLDESAAGGARALLPGCDGRLTVETGDTLPGEAMLEPVRVSGGEPLVVTMNLLEVTDAEEKSLSEPRISFRTDGGFSAKSGFTAGETGGFGQEAEIAGLPLEVESGDGSLLLAVYAGVTRTPASGTASSTLVARRAESFWLRKGRPIRWTVDSSWDGGKAALVLELTLERPGSPPR